MHPNHPSLSVIFYTGLGHLLPAMQQKLAATAHQFVEASAEMVDYSDADVLMIGPEENNLVKLVQKVAANDRHISLLVLAYPAQIGHIKQSVQFAPFVGKNTLCIAYTESLDVEMAIKNAVLRTRQRRSFARINKMPGTVRSIASSAVKLDHLGTFLEQAPIGALLIDDENRVVALNGKAKRMFDAGDNKAYVVQDLLPGLSIQQLKLGFDTSFDSERKVIEVNGRYLELHLSGVKNDEGRTLHILLANDVTEQIKKETALAESEALFRFMAEAMPQKVWTATEKGIVNFFNQHWITYTGLTMDQLKEGLWTGAIHPDDIGHVMSVWQQALHAGEEFELEERMQRKDGEYRWHLVRGVPRKDVHGRVMLWVGTNTDIHEQKEFSTELERRVKERTFELEKSNSELEQFVYVTSHDLQEPIRKIRIFSEIIKESEGALDAQSKKYIEKISETALRMTTLLKALLNFTQMSKQEQLENTDLGQIVSKALIDLELAISEKSARFSIETLPVINAVAVQMHQLFYNLLNNALKFSVSGHPPFIQITVNAAPKHTIERFPYLLHDRTYHQISVKDNGIGFDQHHAEQIFHIFQRLHNRSEYSGTGIGLALCKKVVTNHYGAIYAESEKGKGAVFHILLPADQ